MPPARRSYCMVMPTRDVHMHGHAYARRSYAVSCPRATLQLNVKYVCFKRRVGGGITLHWIHNILYIYIIGISANK